MENASLSEHDKIVSLLTDKLIDWEKLGIQFNISSYAMKQYLAGEENYLSMPMKEKLAFFYDQLVALKERGQHRLKDQQTQTDSAHTNLMLDNLWYVPTSNNSGDLLEYFHFLVIRVSNRPATDGFYYGYIKMEHYSQIFIRYENDEGRVGQPVACVYVDDGNTDFDARLNSLVKGEAQLEEFSPYVIRRAQELATDLYQKIVYIIYSTIQDFLENYGMKAKLQKAQEDVTSIYTFLRTYPIFKPIPKEIQRLQELNNNEYLSVDDFYQSNLGLKILTVASQLFDNYQQIQQQIDYIVSNEEISLGEAVDLEIEALSDIQNKLLEKAPDTLISFYKGKWSFHEPEELSTATDTFYTYHRFNSVLNDNYQESAAYLRLKALLDVFKPLLLEQDYQKLFSKQSTY